MQRTRETIAPYAAAAGLDVLEEPELIEAHIGEWERVSFRDIVLADEEMLHRVRHQEPVWRYAPGVERLASFRERVCGAIDRILDRHPHGDVMVVCHGGVINAYLAPIMGVDHEMFFLPENTSLNSIIVDGDARRVRFLNDVLHLTDPPLFEQPAATKAP
jgi:probable phosphoglycerate mutase